MGGQSFQDSPKVCNAATPCREGAQFGRISSQVVKDGGCPIVLAGRRFESRSDLAEYLSSLLDSLAVNWMLGPEDAFFVFHLCLSRPLLLKDVLAPVVGFKCGRSQGPRVEKCLYAVAKDGTEVMIDPWECVEAVTPICELKAKQVGDQMRKAPSGISVGVMSDDTDTCDDQKGIGGQIAVAPTVSPKTLLEQMSTPKGAAMSFAKGTAPGTAINAQPQSHSPEELKREASGKHLKTRTNSASSLDPNSSRARPVLKKRASFRLFGAGCKQDSRRCSFATENLVIEMQHPRWYTDYVHEVAKADWCQRAEAEAGLVPVNEKDTSIDNKASSILGMMMSQNVWYYLVEKKVDRGCGFEIILRTHEDFEKLDVALSRRSRETKLPRVEWYDLSRMLDQEKFFEERRGALQLFLDSIASDSSLVNHNAMTKFMGPRYLTVARPIAIKKTRATAAEDMDFYL